MGWIRELQKMLSGESARRKEEEYLRDMTIRKIAKERGISLFHAIGVYEHEYVTIPHMMEIYQVSREEVEKMIEEQNDRTKQLIAQHDVESEEKRMKWQKGVDSLERIREEIRISSITRIPMKPSQCKCGSFSSKIRFEELFSGNKVNGEFHYIGNEYCTGCGKLIMKKYLRSFRQKQKICKCGDVDTKKRYRTAKAHGNEMRYADSHCSQCGKYITHIGSEMGNRPYKL